MPMTVDELYDDFESRLRGFAMSLAKDSDSADDLVQETFIRSMGHLPLLELLSRSQRRSWLFRTLRNVFIDERRSAGRRLAMFEKLTADFDESVQLAPMFPLDMLDGVPDDDRDLLERRYVLGMNSREIGDELGIPPATVRSRLHLVIKRLRSRKEEFL